MKNLRNFKDKRRILDGIDGDGDQESPRYRQKISSIVKVEG